MTYESDERKRKARERLNPDDPLRDLTDDPRDAARRRLERRLASRSGVQGEGGLSQARPDGASHRAEPPSGRQRGVSRDASDSDLPASVDHADLLGEGTDSRGHRSSRRSRSSSHSSRLASMLGGFISLPRPFIIGAGVVVLVLLFVLIGAVERSCSGPETATPVQTEPTQEASAEQEQAEPQVEQADLSKLPSSLSQDMADKLADMASTDERVAHIINTIGEALGDEGEAEQVKMLELAADDPEAIDFVAGMADHFPSDAGEAFDGEITKGEIPLLMQWDERWGYTTYCGSSFASAGCCPTSFSMVYMGLTGKTDMTPYDMGQLATEDGYAVDYQGTVGSFLIDEAPGLGLQCEPFYPDAGADVLTSYLQSGYVVICNVGAGDFTDGGHFFVITGKDGDGKLTINDPYSSVRSAQTWDADTILNQTIALYAFKAA